MLQTAIGCRNLSENERQLIIFAAKKLFASIQEIDPHLPEEFKKMHSKVKTVYLSKLMHRLNPKFAPKCDDSWTFGFMTAIFKLIRNYLQVEIQGGDTTLRNLIKSAFFSVFECDGVTLQELPNVDHSNFDTWDDLLSNLEEVIVYKPKYILCSMQKPIKDMDIKISEYDYRDSLKFLNSLNFEGLHINKVCNLKNG